MAGRQQQHRARASSSSASSSLAVFFFFTLLVTALLKEHAATAQAVPPVAVRVGVILDLSTAVSLRRRTGIKMAVEDYYAAHPRSATRVELHFRDSAGDAVGAASADLYIITGKQESGFQKRKTKEKEECFIKSQQGAMRKIIRKESSQVPPAVDQINNAQVQAQQVI